MLIQEGGGLLWGTHGAGAWRRPLLSNATTSCEGDLWFSLQRNPATCPWELSPGHIWAWSQVLRRGQTMRISDLGSASSPQAVITRDHRRSVSFPQHWKTTELALSSSSWRFTSWVHGLCQQCTNKKRSVQLHEISWLSVIAWLLCFGFYLLCDVR